MKPEQQKEIDKYIHVYGTRPDYKLGVTRGKHARHDLALTTARGSYLDVGCGRGEMLHYAEHDLGFAFVYGTETVPQLYEPDDIEFALATALPFSDGQFDVVSCFDVLEHLLPEDTEQALTELARVARHSLLLTANNNTSNSLGFELHINRRHYQDWDDLIRKHCGGSVQWLDNNGNISETWLVTYD